MALETYDSSSTPVLNYLLYNSFSSDLQPISLFNNNNVAAAAKCEDVFGGAGGVEKNKKRSIPAEGKLKKRRRRQRCCKNKEEAESQRMTHITVERNRRKMMNDYLALLRSLMPHSYVQRGDQASIVGGSIDFLKELEHRLQILEAQKTMLLEQAGRGGGNSCSNRGGGGGGLLPKEWKWKDEDCGIEVTLIERHANVKMVSRRRVKQLSKLVIAFQSMYLTILHLNVTTLDPHLVLYSLSLKVEEACVLTSADEIGSAVNHILTIIQEEAHPHF